jgi:hypothetical protein
MKRRDVDESLREGGREGEREGEREGGREGGRMKGGKEGGREGESDLNFSSLCFTGRSMDGGKNEPRAEPAAYR